MKIRLSLVFLLLYNLSFSQVATDKPRYLKKPVQLTPIDISKMYSKEGIIKSNPATITVTESKSKLIEVGLNETPISVKAISDTSLNYSIEIQSGKAFDIIDQIGSFSIIKFWPQHKASGQGLLNAQRNKKRPWPTDALDLNNLKSQLIVKDLIAKQDTILVDLTRSYYIIPTSSLFAKSTEFENKKDNLNIGLLAMPMKIRPFATESGQFDFTSGLSLGATLNWTMHHNFVTDFSHNLLIFAGASTYTADEGKIKEKREDYKITSFSPAIGYMIEKKKIQLSALIGIDFPSGTLQKNWVYRNKPWFGIGVGIALFNISNTENDQAGLNPE